MTKPDNDSDSNTTSNTTTNTTSGNSQHTINTIPANAPLNWAPSEPDGTVTEGAHLNLEKRNK